MGAGSVSFSRGCSHGEREIPAELPPSHQNHFLPSLKLENVWFKFFIQISKIVALGRSKKKN